MVVIPTEEQLLAAAAHFGHPQPKWNPKMSRYLHGVREGIHVFDLTQTRTQLEKCCATLRDLQSQSKIILFVSTKQQAIPMVERICQELRQPFVTKKWIPGLMTNWPTIKRRLQYYLDLRKSFQTGEVEKYTKKEQTDLRKKLAKLDVALSGVAQLTGLPHAIFVVDAVRDHVAVLEAKKLAIPVYGICDSNADPDEFAIPIPANDDASKSLDLILSTVEKALIEGRDSKPAPKDKE